MRIKHMARARFWTGCILYAAGLATALGAQPTAQIATAKNNRPNTAAAVGGQAPIPSGSRGKPRFPIIPAGVPIKAAGPAPANQQMVAANKNAVSGQTKIGVTNTNTNANVNSAASGNRATSKPIPVVPPSSAPTGKGATSSASSQASAATTGTAPVANAAPPSQ